eukprot:3314573-Rhodomonas_salina.2
MARRPEAGRAICRRRSSSGGSPSAVPPSSPGSRRALRAPLRSLHLRELSQKGISSCGVGDCRGWRKRGAVIGSATRQGQPWTRHTVRTHLAQNQDCRTRACKSLAPARADGRGDTAAQGGCESGTVRLLQNARSRNQPLLRSGLRRRKVAGRLFALAHSVGAFRSTLLSFRSKPRPCTRSGSHGTCNQGRRDRRCY